MMKNALFAACIVAMPLAHAETEVVLDSKVQMDEYIASVGGPVGCKMPKDLDHPQVGDCEVMKGYVETGWKLVRVDDACYRQEVSLAGKRAVVSQGAGIELPQIETRRFTVKCPV